MKYELQRREYNPHSHVENLLKNRTYYGKRWKGIAISNDYNKIKAMCPKNNEYRVIDLDTLEVV